MEEASFLTRFASSVTVVNRRTELRASKIMQDRARENEKIQWALDRTPVEVVTSETGVKGLKVRNNETGEEELIEAEGVFVAIGHTPNTGFLGNQITTDPTGYILVKPGTTETNIRACSLAAMSRTHVTAKRLRLQAQAVWPLWTARNISKAIWCMTGAKH